MKVLFRILFLLVFVFLVIFVIFYFFEKNKKIMESSLGIKSTELNQQIQDFLNKEGEFTEEKVQELVFGHARNKEEMRLGWFDSNPALEGILLGSHKINDYILMEVGLLDRNKERFVTVVGIPSYLFDGTNNMNLGFYRYDEDNGGSVLMGDLKNENEILEKLETLKNKAIVFGFEYQNLIISDKDRERCGETILRFIEDAEGKIEIAEGLAAGVWTNGIQKDISGNEIDITKVGDIKDIYNLDISDIPIIGLKIYLN